MRFRNALTPVLGSPTKLGLLRTMFASAGRHWTGRELARTARVSSAQAARDLAELAETSLVIREVVGNSYSWQLNPTHVLNPVLNELFRRESGLRAEMLGIVWEELRSTKIERARVFGSVARGEERDDSDVDLFLQIPKSADRERTEEAVTRLRSRLWGLFGNPVSALIYTRSEVGRPLNPALLKAIEQEGVEVSGRD